MLATPATPLKYAADTAAQQCDERRSENGGRCDQKCSFSEEFTSLGLPDAILTRVGLVVAKHLAKDVV